MDSERNKGIIITPEQAIEEISIVGGGIKIAASGKPISTRFAVNWGKIFIVVDCSGSMVGNKLDQAKSGIEDFSKDAFKKNYLVGIIKFSSRAEYLSDPVNDIAILQYKIQNIHASGSTNLTSAIKMAHSKLADFTGSKVMVIATDGMPDNIKSSLKEADLAKSDGIEILTIGTDDADVEFLKKLASRTELSNKVTSDMFAQAISKASFLLASPKSIKPK
jgi:molecular chaperone DnaK